MVEKQFQINMFSVFYYAAWLCRQIQNETDNIFYKNDKLAYIWYVFSIVALCLALLVTIIVCPISAQ